MSKPKPASEPNHHAKATPEEIAFMVRHKMWQDPKAGTVHFIAEMTTDLISQRMRKEVEGSEYYKLFEEELTHRGR
jgi:hypothetical protein